jgi:hypothetical protein
MPLLSLYMVTPLFDLDTVLPPKLPVYCRKSEKWLKFSFTKSMAMSGNIPNSKDAATVTIKTTTIPTGIFVNLLSSAAGRKNICVMIPK